MTNEEAIVKMQRYCTYQDRCHHDVRYKLVSIKVYGDQLEEVMSTLIQDGYLNDERYARNYARGKYRMNKWGKLRITRSLKAKNISAYCIKQAMKEIDDEGDYYETLRAIVNKYMSERKDKYDTGVIRQKTFQHALSKGFEADLISKVIEEANT